MEIDVTMAAKAISPFLDKFGAKERLKKPATANGSIARIAREIASTCTFQGVSPSCALKALKSNLGSQWFKQLAEEEGGDTPGSKMSEKIIKSSALLVLNVVSGCVVGVSDSADARAIDLREEFYALLNDQENRWYFGPLITCAETDPAIVSYFAHTKAVEAAAASA